MSEPRSRLLGPWMTLALVIGGVVGSGIFYLPIALAPLGGSVPFGWLISGVGVMALAYCSSRIVSRDGGGLQAYVENELGRAAGFIVTWMTWCATWVGIPAVALAGAGLAQLMPGLAGHVIALSLLIMAVLAMVNLYGVRATGDFAVVTVLIRILPMAAVVAIVAMLGVKGGSLQPINVPAPSLGNIATASALCLFALTGFEFAMSPVGKIRDPRRNLVRALIIGLAGVAVAYLLTTLSLSLILPNARIAKSLTPFPDAIGTYWGSGAATLATLAITVSALGGLNVAMLGCGEMLFSMGLRGDMPRYFTRTNRFNAPYAAQLGSLALSCALLALNAANETAQLFKFFTLLASDAVLYLYGAAAIAAATRDKKPLTWLAAAIGLTFVLFAFYGSGLESFLLSLGLAALGVVIFLFRKPWIGQAPPIAVAQD
jgi:APA family basic amino acid/polyamine antiporter